MPTREEVARREVGHTEVTPATARALVFVFAASLAVAPAVEWLGGPRPSDGEAFASAWSHLAALPADALAAWRVTTAPGEGAWDRLVAANRTVLAGLSRFETALEDESTVGRALRPPAQRVLARWLGAGNERTYLGRDGWLFYRPDVDYATGPGFLDPGVLARRVASASEWASPPAPDPRDAIGLFHRQLATRGIALVVMPTPLKPTVHPERLAGAAADWTPPVHNPSYAAFVEGLRRDRVLVFDPSAELVARPQGPRYLATDSHWRPETMEAVARRLATWLETRVALPAVPDPAYRTEIVDARHTGDLARMLDLPATQALFPPETVRLRRVLRPDGSPWRPSRSGDVLVLGDSFSNIYSLASMGWGDAAGFVEQLSAALGRPVDRIVQNDDGAFATREMLRRELARDPGRLDATRVIVYQFAARELAIGDWRRIELPPSGGS